MAPLFGGRPEIKRCVGDLGDKGRWFSGLVEMVDPCSSALRICSFIIKYGPIILPYLFFFRNSNISLALNPMPQSMTIMLATGKVSFWVYSSHIITHGCLSLSSLEDLISGKLWGYGEVGFQLSQRSKLEYHRSPWESFPSVNFKVIT